MTLGLFICLVAAAVSLVTAGIWLCLAFWLRTGTKVRSLGSVLMGQLAFGIFLIVDGAPFNGVIFTLFFLPLIALQAFVVVLLEARDFAPEG